MQATKALLASYPEYIRQAKKDISKTDLFNITTVKRYADSWEKFRNNEETVENISAYGDSVRALHGLPASPKS